MTAPDVAAVAAGTASSAPAPNPPATRRSLIFGTGLGIAIGRQNLDVVVVRSRPAGASLRGATTIADFRSRPAAEWGAELHRFLAGAHERHVSATLLLPRGEVIVRSLQIPGVADKDVSPAIALQIDTLHPFGDEAVDWAWARTSSSSVVLGIVRRDVLQSYETLFSEAGIPVAGITFSASVIYSALRLWRHSPAAALVWIPGEGGRVEVYGESPSRPVYSAELSLATERAFAIARGELRLDPDYGARPLGEALPRPSRPGEVLHALAWATALTASAPLVSRVANLLPAERRASSARKQLILPAILSVLLIAALIVGFVVIPAIERRKLLAGLNDEIHRLEPAAQRAQALDRRVRADRAKIAALDDFRRRPQADLDVLNELTRLLPPQVWTNSIEIYPDSVVLSGEADQAAPLLKLLDSSPLFQNSDFALSVTRNGVTQGEQFRIKTMRRNRIGRTTP